jgi:NDP-sugar pyrophosphorylase family protein
MLLAAGHGTRMEPLSSLVAKPALEVLGRPLLASALGHLLGAGCGPIVANLHRHPDQVAAAVYAAAAGTRVLFSREPTLLGGAGGVAAARRLFGPGPVLVANADVWATLDLSALLATSDEGRVTLALLPHPDPRRWSSVLLDDYGRVAGFLPAGGDPPSPPYLFTGFQLLGAAAVAALPPPPAEWRPWWLDLRSRGRLHGAVVSGSWREAGTPDSFRALVLGELGTGSWVHPLAEVAPGATLERSAIGAGCRVETGAVVLESVVTAGATIGRAGRVQRCIVAGPVVLEPGEKVADALVLPDRRATLTSAAPP